MDGMDSDQVQKFEEEIGMRLDPEKEALAKLRAYQEAMGIVIENLDAGCPGRQGAGAGGGRGDRRHVDGRPAAWLILR